MLDVSVAPLQGGESETNKDSTSNGFWYIWESALIGYINIYIYTILVLFTIIAITHYPFLGTLGITVFVS